MSAREEALRKRAQLLQNQLADRSAQQQPEKPAAQENGQPAQRSARMTVFPGAPAGRPESVEDITLREMATPAISPAAGFSGAVAGAKAGSAFGPIGTFVGTVGGGAIGTFGGEIAEDALNQEDFDFARATEEALLSAGIDVGTLGVGKLLSPLKPAFFSIRNKLGFEPKEAAEEILNRVAQEGGRAGSPESIAATQLMLSSGGASLTPAQTGSASNLQVLGDRIARTGIFSQNVINKNLLEQSRIINERMGDLFSRAVSGGEGLGPENIGRVFFEGIQEGKLALGDAYQRGLTEISKTYGQATVPKTPILREAEQFLKDNEFAGGTASELNDQSLKFVQDFVSKLEAAPNSLTVSDLFKYEKKLQLRINELSDSRSAGFNSEASAQLSQLASRVRDRTTEVFGNVNPDLKNKFQSLKNQYSNGINQIIPKINKTMIDNASSKGAFYAIGDTLTSTGDKNQIDAFFSSIDRAYSEAAKEGRDLPFKSAEEVKDIVREGYVAKQFPGLGPDFDLRKYSKKAEFFETPANEEQARAILGEKYEPFKQLVNAMAEASVTPNSNLGELVARTKEYAAFSDLATGKVVSGGLQGTAAGAASVGVGGLSGAAAAGTILLAPVFLAKVATNKQNVNKIIAFNKKSFGSREALQTAATNLVADVFKTLSEEDKKEIRQSISAGRSVPTEPVMMQEEK